MRFQCSAKKIFMQTTQRRTIYFGILVLGLLWIGLSVDRSGASTNGLIPAPQEGFLAPDFTLTTPDGESYQLSALRGQVVLINFWASWCPPCRAEMPAFQNVYNDYKETGLVVLAVNTAWQDTPEAREAFVAEYGLTFPILLDNAQTASRLYRIQAMPTSFLVGRDGRIRLVLISAISEASLRAQVESLLKEDAP